MKKSDRKALVWSICIFPIIALSVLLGLVFVGAWDASEGFKESLHRDHYLGITAAILGYSLLVFLIVFWARRITEDGIYVFRERPKNINDRGAV